MAEIESGGTYSGIKFKGLNSWVTEVLQSVLNSKFVGRVEQGETRQVCLLIPARLSKMLGFTSFTLPTHAFRL